MARIAVLTDAHRAWLGSLPLTVEPVPGVLASHAVPDHDATYLTQTVVRSTVEHPDGVREATDDELVERLGAAYGSYAPYLCAARRPVRPRGRRGVGGAVRPSGHRSRATDGPDGVTMTTAMCMDDPITGPGA